MFSNDDGLPTPLPLEAAMYESTKGSDGVRPETKVVEMSRIHGYARPPDDSYLIQDAMKVLLDDVSPCCAYDPAVEPILRIVSICSSSDTAHKFVIPKLLAHYHRRRRSGDQEIHAQITHVVPPHKKNFMLNTMDRARRDHHAYRSHDDHADDDYFSLTPQLHRSRSLYSTPPRAKPSSMFTATATATTATNRNTLLDDLMLDTSSPPLSPTFSDTSSSHYRKRSSTSSTCSTYSGTSHHGDGMDEDYETLMHYQNKIYNNFALISRSEHDIPVVPPFSVHYALNIHPLPTHVLPTFSSLVKTQLLELTRGGVMVVCYPTSRRLYDHHVLPCIDLALHQLLALNMISTQACEDISTPPNTETIPSFQKQQSILSELADAEILYSAEVNGYECFDWGYRWLNEEVEWLKTALANAGFFSSQTLLNLIEGMTKNKQWSSGGLCDVGVFVIRKTP